MSLAESLSVAVSWEGGGGGGNTPYDCPYREAPPKSDTFSRLQAIKMQGFRELKYTKGQGNLSVMSCKRVFN